MENIDYSPACRMEFGVFWTGCFHWQRWIIALVYFHKACCCSTDEENIPTRDLSQWRGALAEHEQLLKRWEKAWVGLSVLFSPVSRLDCVCVTCVGFNLLCMFGCQAVFVKSTGEVQSPGFYSSNNTKRGMRRKS